MRQIIENISDKNRVGWIDIGKGISMIIVIIFHTECYYLGAPRSLTSFLIPPLMNFFFFLSGFFFLKGDKIDMKKKLKQILKTIIVPYVIFTSIIFIPKALKWGGSLSIGLYLQEVFLGQASWFVMALMVGQILMIFISSLKPRMMIYVGVISYIVYMILSPEIEFQPFYYMEGIRSVIFLVLGHIYYRNRERIKNILHNTIQYNTIQYNISILLLVSLYCIYYWGLIDNDYGLIILASSLVGLHTFSIISKGIESYCHKTIINSIISIGQNSLIYYFLNGGVISVLVIIMNRFVTYNVYYMYIIIALTIIFIAIATKFILRFCPAIVGRK